MVEFTDEEIADLVAEEKQLPDNYREILIGVKMKKVDAHKRGDLEIDSVEGNTFSIMVRQSTSNLLNFSVILTYKYEEKIGNFILCRYNGKSHWHTNKIEKERFRDFHIHIATERYQEAGYAEVTSRYADLAGALSCLLQDSNFVAPPNPQPNLL